MKSSWTQPSLSRDFALLAAVIFVVLGVLSAVVTYGTYVRHFDRIRAGLEKESLHIEHMLDAEMENGNYLLGALAKQIVLSDPDDLPQLAKILKSFDNPAHLYALLTWVNPEHQLVISSDQGVRKHPIDMSDRDYVQKTFDEPWKMIVGKPVEGRASARWILPIAMGVTDHTGKFIGTVVISIDIHRFNDRIRALVQRDDSSFAIVSKAFIPLAQVSEDKDFIANHFPAEKLAEVNFTSRPNGMIGGDRLFWSDENYSYYRVSQNQPYIVLLSYDRAYSDESIRGMLFSRLLLMAGLALFFVIFLWLVRARLIAPVVRMTEIIGGVASGKPAGRIADGGAMELASLAQQVRRVGEYIGECKRMESELRYKLQHMKNAREEARMRRRSLAEFMAFVSQELRAPLNHILGGAQAMKDQLYGPLENRKYRQYAADQFDYANRLLERAQDLEIFAKADAGYVELDETPVNVEQAVAKAVRFLTDKMQAGQLSIKVDLHEPLPRLIVDEFRFQQILTNLLLYALNNTQPGAALSLSVRVITEHRDRRFLAFMIGPENAPAHTEDALLAMASDESEAAGAWDDVGLALAYALTVLHKGILHIRAQPGSVPVLALFMPGSRIRMIGMS